MFRYTLIKNLIASTLLCSLLLSPVLANPPTIPEDAAARRAFLQPYIDRGRASIRGFSTKYKAAILCATFETCYLPLLERDWQDQEARKIILTEYKNLKKLIKIDGNGRTAGELRPLPRIARHNWERGERTWPADRQAHHIIPVAYCWPERAMRAEWWNILPLSATRHAEIEGSPVFRFLFPKASVHTG